MKEEGPPEKVYATEAFKETFGYTAYHTMAQNEDGIWKGRNMEGNISENGDMSENGNISENRDMFVKNGRSNI